MPIDLPPGFVHQWTHWDCVAPLEACDYSGSVAWVACPWGLQTPDPAGVERALKRDYAKALGRWCFDHNLPCYVPVLQADALGLDDTDPLVRQKAMAMGHQLMGHLGLVVFGIDGGCTEGMRQDLQWANRAGCCCRWVSLPGWRQQFEALGCYCEEVC